jgi:indolepyruvate ferredoxin oxidoreductase alpha subunit
VAGTLLSGNEAAARGAWESGAMVGTAYPGTPSTETLEAFAAFPDVYAEWAPNEKVALEVAAGASMMGARALVTMKHVGLNVAADPLFTLAYTGVGAGLVIFVADDPGMHSSQNEQDSRNYAAFARIPLLEPSDSQEALDFTKQAFELSEQFDTPVLVRSTVRLSHAKGLVRTGVREERVRADYSSDPAKWVMIPANARGRRVELEERLARLGEVAESTPLNRAEYRDESVGVLCSGVIYQYVREALPDASVLKLGLSFPLAEGVIRAFAERVGRLIVVEEADGYLLRSVRSSGIELDVVDLPAVGEVTPGAIQRALGLREPPMRAPVAGLPGRPPLMCPGCPHRPVFYALRRARAAVTGDIGCYTLGALKPLSAMDSCVCMGASIGMAHGAELAGGADGRPVVGVIGDSTFAHSGVTGLMDMTYNRGVGTICILDNRITAMTGHQGNPVVGITAQAGRPGREIDIAALCESLGVDRVRTVDPHDLGAAEAAIREEVALQDQLSVIVFRAPCALLVKERDQLYAVDEEACTACGVCVRLGCPAISLGEANRAEIDVSVCVGCSQCVQVCRYDAIVSAGAACDIGSA